MNGLLWTPKQLYATNEDDTSYVKHCGKQCAINHLVELSPTQSKIRKVLYCVVESIDA